MSLNRRDFVKLCTGTVAGFGVAQMFHPAVREALAGTLTGERPPVIWLQGQGCTGCSVSLLNNVNPSIADVLLKIISLEYHPTVMGGEGHDAYTHMLNIAKNFKGKFFLPSKVPPSTKIACGLSSFWFIRSFSPLVFVLV